MSHSESQQQLQRLLDPVYGFSYLGLIEEAKQAMYEVPQKLFDEPAVVEARIHLHMAGKEWEIGSTLALKQCSKNPQDPEPFIQAAYCLHEIGKTFEARKTLALGPESLKNSAIFHYNMACYECRLGNIATAKSYLVKAFKLDRRFIDESKDDNDLSSLQDFIENNCAHLLETPEDSQN